MLILTVRIFTVLQKHKPCFQCTTIRRIRQRLYHSLSWRPALQP